MMEDQEKLFDALIKIEKKLYKTGDIAQFSNALKKIYKLNIASESSKSFLDQAIEIVGTLKNSPYVAAARFLIDVFSAVETARWRKGISDQLNIIQSKLDTIIQQINNLPQITAKLVQADLIDMARNKVYSIFNEYEILISRFKNGALTEQEFLENVEHHRSNFSIELGSIFSFPAAIESVYWGMLHEIVMMRELGNARFPQESIALKLTHYKNNVFQGRARQQMEEANFAAASGMKRWMDNMRANFGYKPAPKEEITIVVNNIIIVYKVDYSANFTVVDANGTDFKGQSWPIPHNEALSLLEAHFASIKASYLEELKRFQMSSDILNLCNIALLEIEAYSVDINATIS